ncbi:MAG: hypothetical protein RBS40_02575 [Rhodocyclaceae bacterium]|jgi:hypothetical protein|nr:hypothetical protein [Rhodocyclaceae bacterium]
MGNRDIQFGIRINTDGGRQAAQAFQSIGREADHVKQRLAGIERSSSAVAAINISIAGQTLEQVGDVYRRFAENADARFIPTGVGNTPGPSPKWGMR